MCANEFIHGTVGVSMTQAEFEAVGLHVLNSQATGDVIYASSATQLSRLAVGATDTILSVQGGIPSWRTPANILTDLTGQAGAAFSWNSQNLTSVGTIGAVSLSTSAAIPLLLTNGQLVNISLTSQTVGATTLTIPDFASVVDEFVFKTKAVTMSNKTFVAPALGAATATSINGLIITTTAGTLTIANNASAALVTSGNYSITLTATAATSVTLPTTGTLATLAGAETITAKVSYNGLIVTPNTGAITTGSWTATVISPVYGGTGIANNVASTITITGAYSLGFTVSAATALTLPTTGTLATLAGTEELDSKTLDSSVGKGTWTASGTWTIPAITLGGAVTGNGQAITGLSNLTITGTSADRSISVVTTTSGAAELKLDKAGAGDYADILLIQGGTNKWQIGMMADLNLSFYNTANTNFPLQITAGATNIITWANSTHTGLVLSGFLNAAANYMSFTEMSAPGAGAADTARVYAVVGGDTLTDLAAVFQDGSVDIFAQEVTEPDSPIFQFPDMTDLKLQLRKPDHKTVQFAAIFPDGREFIMREFRYPIEKWN